MVTREELKTILENVPRSYPDFVEGGLDLGDEYPEYPEKLVDFLRSNPDADASDVVKFETEQILGIKPITPDEPPE